MSRRKFVREIKAKEVKNINPSDIIYLAMKDGSLILIADDDDEKIQYEDLKLNISNKRRHRYYNKNSSTNQDSSLYSFEKDDDLKVNTSSNNISENRNRNVILSNYKKSQIGENRRNNKTINLYNQNYEINNEKLDKSFDDIKVERKNNIGYHEIEYFNNPNKSFDSNKAVSIFHDRTKRNRNYIINNNYNKNNEERKKNEYNDESIDSNRSKNQLRSKSSINIIANSGKSNFIKKKEMEIMGRIINDSNSYKNIDHKHPNTLFDEKCLFCQKLAKENNLSISNIKVESNYDNCSFFATFGDIERKQGKRLNDNNGNYYL
jgi:predicted phosphatase